MGRQVSAPALTAALAATLALSAAPASAAEIVIRDFVGKVSIMDGAPSVEVLRNARGLDIDEVGTEDRFVIDGGIRKPSKEGVCDYKGGGLSFNLTINGRDYERSKWDKRLEDYPDLDIFVPEGSTLSIENSYVLLKATTALRQAKISKGGCLPIALGDVGELDASIAGSGNFSAHNVGTLSLSKSGSSDLVFETIGAATISASGSGDIEIGHVTQSADISKSGSGDIEIDQVDGDLAVAKSGSGDIEVDGGFIPELTIRKSGAGDVNIDADIGDGDVVSRGAGDVYIEAVRGSLSSKMSGSGDLKRGDD